MDRGVFIESFRQAPRLWSHCKRRTAWPKSVDDRNLERWRENLMRCYQTLVTWPASTLQLKPESWVITGKKIWTVTFTAEEKINDPYKTLHKVFFTWTRTCTSLCVLTYSFSSGCKRSSRHGSLRQAVIIPNVVLAGARQRWVLGNNQRRRWYCWIISPP